MCEERERAASLLSHEIPLPLITALSLLPLLKQAKAAPPRPLTAAAAAPVVAPALSTDAPSLSAFGLLPHELLTYPPGSLSRVAGVDGEGTLWVELLLDESESESESENDDETGEADGEESDGLSLRSALSPTALRPGDAMPKAPEHVRIDFEARRARRDQKLQRKRAEAAAAAAAVAAASKAEQAKAQKGRVRR